MATAEDILLAAEDPKYEEIVFRDQNLILDSMGNAMCYKLFVNNGVLTMTNTAYTDDFVSDITMIDASSSGYYKLYVENAALCITELNTAPSDANASIIFIDSATEEEHKLYVNNGKLLLNTAVVVDGDGNYGDVLVIDSDLRTIHIPSTVTNLGVESDDDVLSLRFRMPRYYCGIDLSEFVIRINYENANDEGDVYEVKDATVDTDTITFSWLVGRPAVAYDGDVKFVVCLKKFGEDGETVEKEFNSTIAVLPVLEGLETSEAVFQEYPDIIMQFRREQKEMIEEAVVDWMASNEVLSDERVNAAVTLYFTENPIEISDEQVGALVDDYFVRNPVTGVTDEMVATAVEGYMTENPIEVPDVDLSNYYTKTEVDTAIGNVDVDLSNYYTKSEVDDTLTYYPDEGKVYDIASGCSPLIVSIYDFYPTYNDVNNTIKSWDGVYTKPTANTGTLYSGTCGDGVTWRITNDSELVISGTGAMTDYTDSSSATPWADHISLITSIIIEEGVTHIGDYAFYRCESASGTLVIPSTVETIGARIIYYTAIDTVIVESEVKITGSNGALHTGADTLSIKYVKGPPDESEYTATGGSDKLTVYFKSRHGMSTDAYNAHYNGRAVILVNSEDETIYSLDRISRSEAVFTRTIQPKGYDYMLMITITHSVDTDELTVTREFLATAAFVSRNKPQFTALTYSDEYALTSANGSGVFTLTAVHIYQYGNVVHVDATISGGSADCGLEVFDVSPYFTFPKSHTANAIGTIHSGKEYGGMVLIGGGAGLGIRTSSDYDPSTYSYLHLTYMTA